MALGALLVGEFMRGGPDMLLATEDIALPDASGLVESESAGEELAMRHD